MDSFSIQSKRKSNFENEQPHIARLTELKQRIINSTAEYKGEKLAGKIRRRYQMKNNNGYLLNAFLDFDTPLDILTHLLIGSEGTLGFIAEAVLHTLPDYAYKYTGRCISRISMAPRQIIPSNNQRRVAEIMDQSLRAVENMQVCRQRQAMPKRRQFCGVSG
jgi:hypothetical protein